MFQVLVIFVIKLLPWHFYLVSTTQLRVFQQRENLGQFSHKEEFYFPGYEYVSTRMKFDEGHLFRNDLTVERGGIKFAHRVRFDIITREDGIKRLFIFSDT